MSEREKFIEALENAEAIDGVLTMSNQFRDLLVELLKEQDAVDPVSDPYVYWLCGSCGKEIDYRHKYCPWCGKQVKWE